MFMLICLSVLSFQVGFDVDGFSVFVVSEVAGYGPQGADTMNLLGADLF